MCRLCLLTRFTSGLATACCRRASTASIVSRNPAVQMHGRLYSSETNGADKPTSSGAPSAAEDASTAALALAEKEAKLREVSDSYLRLLAEMENLRQRTRREVEQASQFGISRFAKDVIGLADVMEMAIKAVDPVHPLLTGQALEAREQVDEDAQATPDIDVGAEGNGYATKYRQLIRGLEMTLEEVRKVFGRHGISAIEPLHQRFDPNLHNALFQVPCADVDPGIVVSVAKRGYILHQRVLRAADVGVSRKP